MSKVIHLKKGLDINLQGVAEKILTAAPLAQEYALTPDDYIGVIPKLLVKVDDAVKAGTPLFFDKKHPEVLFTSPISGVVTAINRGEKRKILNIVIRPSEEREYEEFNPSKPEELTAESLKELMLKSGLWPFVIQRPYGIIADPKDTPRDIFVSGFDSAPLAADFDFILQNTGDDFAIGIEAIKKLTTGKVYLGLSDESHSKVFSKLEGVVEENTFTGPHPAGNVGVQIHHIAPINKGEVVWTMDVYSLIFLGRLLRTGKLDMSKVIALAGSCVEKPRYYRIISGARVDSILENAIKPLKEGQSVRVISGNVLTGKKIDKETGFITNYANMVTVIPEGDHYEMLGWIAPRLGKFSMSRTYFSWLTPKKSYNLDTNLNGGRRALVMSGEYEKVLPMDIYPVYLVKAILAGDIDKMENLGIYEVIEEDLALCEFVCTSKTEVQKIVRDGITQMIKELN